MGQQITVEAWQLALLVFVSLFAIGVGIFYYVREIIVSAHRRIREEEEMEKRLRPNGNKPR